MMRLMTLCVAMVAAFSGSAMAADWPTKPVRIVVGFAPGGPADTVARIAAERLQQDLGQPVIVENKAGAGGQLGTTYVSKAAPDGYTLLMTSSNAHGAGPALWDKVPYHPMKDFTHLALIAQSPIVLVAKTSSPHNSLADVINASKANGGKVTFGSGGPGGMGHLTGELIQSVAGFNMVHVPYKGSSAALVDLMGGQIDVISDVMATYVPHVKAGNAKFLAVSTPTRVGQFPDLKTFGEQGYPQASASAWFGLTAPANLPPEVVSRIAAAVAKTVSDPAVKARFDSMALVTDQEKANPAGFTKFVQSELDRWSKVAKERNLSMK